MRDSHQSSYQYSSSRRYSNNVHYHPEGDRHHDSSQGHARPSDQLGSPGSAKRRSLLLASPPAPISQSSSGSHPLRIQPEGSSHYRTYSRHDENSDSEMSSAFGRFGLTEQEQIHHSQSHPFNSGEVDECDKYNPLVLHHTRRQSIIQPHALSSWNNGHSSPRISEDHRDGQGVHIGEPSQRKQGLRYHQGSWQMTGKSGVVIPNPTTSPASTATSKTSAHAIISPGSSRSSSTVVSPLSPKFSRDGRGFFDSLPTDTPETSQSANSTGGRRSFPGEASTNLDLAARKRSSTVASPPTLLNTLFQRARNPQDCLPISNRSPLSLTDEDLKTVRMSDSQLVKHQTKQEWRQDRGERSTPGTGIPLSHPSSSSLGQGVPHNGYRGGSHGRRGSHGAEDGYQGRERFSGRFVYQVIFRLDESHESGRGAIMVLRKLRNGLTSTVQQPSPTNSSNQSSRSSPALIPIPKISHLYPDYQKPTTVIVNGRIHPAPAPKTIPSVVINWSDGVREQFDPTGMTLQEILDRCHCPYP
ncbi:hypothetical protein MJO29_014776 [Puccinia striiformis f. sp. tritici]|nr:hypothetical protein MJO29_014776 [Puccinia striiformis f. sp. tritici]